jgi:assimilatory nitrate reductase catalytic subunit
MMKMKSLLPIIHQETGPLTERLILNPQTYGLGSLPTDVVPDATTTAVCGYCSTGCGLKIHLRDGLPVNLTPEVDYPVNLGMACPKGWEALRVLESDDRAVEPLMRQADGSMTAVSWRQAIDVFCDRFKTIQAKHGNEAVAFLSTGQIPTEEMAFLGCLTKFGMGWKHGDANTRQCMATSAVAYKQSFGFDAPPFTYADFEASEVLVFAGANPCIAHPIMWQRVLANKNNPEIVVIDPRRTETAMNASEHLAIYPKSDLTLFYGLAKLLIDMQSIDSEFIRDHTRDFEAFRDHVQAFDLERVSAESGIGEDQLIRVARKIAKSKRVSFWWTMGVNQSYQAVRTAQAIINLALMTGNIGRPGTGANSITGQCNAMGSRLYSNTTTLFGHHDFANAEHRQKIASIFKMSEDRIPSDAGLAYDQILEQVENGKIHGLWVVATNPAHSWINSPRARATLEKLDFLVVQDMYQTTETGRLAHLVLPAAGWGEKEGTFINSERRIGLLKRVKSPPGQALSDFAIFRLIAQRWGCRELFENWTTPEDIFQSMKLASEGQACDITGIDDYKMIDRCGGIQWPFTMAERDATDTPFQERRLFADGNFVHADSRAKFIFSEPSEMPELPDEEFPIIMLSGRGTVSQWHTQSRTAKSAVLRKLYPADPYFEINPLDAAELSIEDQTWAKVCSRRGEATLRAVLTACVQRGQIFVPMHDGQTNHLTNSIVDPYSRQPSYKDCAVRVERAAFHHRTLSKA